MTTSAEDEPLARAMARAAMRREWAARFVVVSQIIVFVAFLVAMVVGILGSSVLAWETPDHAREGSRLQVVVFLLLVALAVVGYLAMLFVPFLVALPVTLPLAVLWSQPRKFLVLRPFNRKPSVRALRAVIRRDIGRYGHTYTLSDRRIRVRWYVRIPLLLGQIAVFSFQPRTITSARRLARLVAAIRRRVLRNLNWCMTRSKIFAVRCSDAHWQAAVTQLAQLSDLVLIDITERRATIAWEIEHCLKIGVIDKVVFLAEAPAAAEARAWIDATLGAGAPPLVRYTGAKLVDAALFRTLVLHHNLRTELPPDRRAQALAISFVAGGYAVMAAALWGLVRWLVPHLAR